MGRIPGFGFRFDREDNARIVRSAEFLQSANIDLGDQFQASLRRFLHVLSEHLPVVIERHDGEPADGRVLTNKQTGRQPLTVPLVGADGPDDVLAWFKRHGYAACGW